MSDGRANRLVDAVGEFDAVALATEFGPESGAGWIGFYAKNAVEQFKIITDWSHSQHLTFLGGGDGALMDAFHIVFRAEGGEFEKRRFGGCLVFREIQDLK